MGGGRGLGRAEWDFERDDGAARGVVLYLEDVRAAVELLESRADAAVPSAVRALPLQLSRYSVRSGTQKVRR